MLSSLKEFRAGVSSAYRLGVSAASIPPLMAVIFALRYRRVEVRCKREIGGLGRT